MSKGGVWLRRLVTGAIANSPVPGSDSAIAPVAMLARHPLSTMPPDLLPFLALALQDRKKQGRRLRMEFYIRRDEMTQRLDFSWTSPPPPLYTSFESPRYHAESATTLRFGVNTVVWRTTPLVVTG